MFKEKRLQASPETWKRFATMTWNFPDVVKSSTWPSCIISLLKRHWVFQEKISVNRRIFSLTGVFRLPEACSTRRGTTGNHHQRSVDRRCGKCLPQRCHDAAEIHVFYLKVICGFLFASIKKMNLRARLFLISSPRRRFWCASSGLISRLKNRT